MAGSARTFGAPSLGSSLSHLLRSLAGLASLPSLRRIAREAGWRKVALVAYLYALLVMFTGEMLVVGSWSTSWLVQGELWGAPFWDHPDLVIWGPGIEAQFPFLATLTMLLASAGTGIGVVVAASLLLRARQERTGGASGAAAGVVPGIAGLSALGACCCVSCVGPSVVAVLANLSATTAIRVLDDDWYVSVFQLAVVWLALIAQERAVRLAQGVCPPEPMRVGPRLVLSVLLRLGLIIAGVSWSLAMFIEMGDTSASIATPGLLYHWIVEHQLLSLAAIALGFFPSESAHALARWGTSLAGRAVRFLLVLGGLTWGLWVPPALVSFGLGGLVNEVLGYLGAPVSWGAVPPDVAIGPALLFHWLFQHLLLSAFAIALGLLPERATQPLLWSVPRLLAPRAERPPVTAVLLPTQG